MRHLFACIVFAFAPGVHGQALFKWSDEKGGVHYGDRLPKGFTGKFEKIEGEAPRLPAAVPPAAVPAPVAPPVVPRPQVAKESAGADIASRRRATRERLQGDVDAAAERLERAREALKTGEAPQDDERQMVQREASKAAAAKRSNCRDAVGANGRATKMCATLIPNEQYYDRMKALEAAVVAAEADLDRAREAYRRGVD